MLALNGRAKSIVERLSTEAFRLRGEARRRVVELIKYVKGNHDWDREHTSFRRIR